MNRLSGVASITGNELAVAKFEPLPSLPSDVTDDDRTPRKRTHCSLQRGGTSRAKPSLVLAKSLRKANAKAFPG